MALTLWPGCDKRIATCANKFNNALNFQGEPHRIGIYALSGRELTRWLDRDY